jgi:hypothetical protein
MIIQWLLSILAFCFLCFVAFMYLVYQEGATSAKVIGGRDPAANPGEQRARSTAQPAEGAGAGSYDDVEPGLSDHVGDRTPATATPVVVIGRYPASSGRGDGEISRPNSRQPGTVPDPGPLPALRAPAGDSDVHGGSAGHGPAISRSHQLDLSDALREGHSRRCMDCA